MSTSGAAAVRSALRRLVRAKNRAFKNDAVMLQAASETIRNEFSRNAGAPSEKVDELLKELDAAIEFLQANVVQAPLNKRGNYEVDVRTIDESKK